MLPVSYIAAFIIIPKARKLAEKVTSEKKTNTDNPILSHRIFCYLVTINILTYKKSKCTSS